MNTGAGYDVRKAARLAVRSALTAALLLLPLGFMCQTRAVTFVRMLPCPSPADTYELGLLGPDDPGTVGYDEGLDDVTVLESVALSGPTCRAVSTADAPRIVARCVAQTGEFSPWIGAVWGYFELSRDCG